MKGISFEDNFIVKKMRSSSNSFIINVYNYAAKKWHKVRDDFDLLTSSTDYVSIFSLLPPPKNDEISIFQAKYTARYLAVEASEENDLDKWIFYEKIIEKEEWHSRERFSLLIETFKNETEDNWCIVIDHNGKVIDGRHRLALFAYYGYRMIHVKRTMVYYDKDDRDVWNELIYSYGFTNSEVETLHKKYIEIYNKVQSNVNTEKSISQEYF